MPPRIIYLHAAAPPKPAEDAACNGCGLCCSAQPCPLGMWLSRRLRGACAALLWDATQNRYLCGALQAPERHLPWLPRDWAQALVRRWIAAQRGCDSDLQALAPKP
jgi:hypothetical protein